MAAFLLLWEEDHVMHSDAGYFKTRYTGRGEVPEWMIYAGSQHQFAYVCEGCDSFSASSDREGMLKTKKRAYMRKNKGPEEAKKAQTQGSRWVN